MGDGLGTYVWPVTVSCPASTPITAPLVTLPGLGRIWIESIDLRIPSGHRGLTGFAIRNSGSQIFPFAQSTAWLNADDEHLDYDVGVQTDTGLQVVTYNTDPTFAHSFYLRIVGYYMVQTQATTPTPALIVPVS